MPYNFAADSFHTKKLCSRLSSSEVHFLIEIGRFAFFWAHIFWPIIDYSSLYAAGVKHALFYAESLSVVTSGHVTKMAVTPFDPPFPKTPCYTQTLRLYLLQNRSYCRLKFYTAGIACFAYCCEKQQKILQFFVRTAQVMQMRPKHIFWFIIDSSSLYAAGVTRIQGVILFGFLLFGFGLLGFI